MRPLRAGNSLRPATTLNQPQASACAAIPIQGTPRSDQSGQSVLSMLPGTGLPHFSAIPDSPTMFRISRWARRACHQSDRHHPDYRQKRHKRDFGMAACSHYAQQNRQAATRLRASPTLRNTPVKLRNNSLSNYANITCQSTTPKSVHPMFVDPSLTTRRQTLKTPRQTLKTRRQTPRMPQTK